MSTISSFIIFTIFTICSIACVAEGVGVNWGTMASHPLPPVKVVKLLKSNNINKVKLFDAKPDVLQALSGSNIGVTVGVPNVMLRGLNSSRKAAENWVHDNVTRYVSNGGGGARIEYVVFLCSLCFVFYFLHPLVPFFFFVLLLYFYFFNS